MILFLKANGKATRILVGKKAAVIHKRAGGTAEQG